ncbi:unnamed protein product [Symbiodinium sp. CCMP2456]|nr:unnamed protein product [Symbiodinium sp. CCMP2456]
MNQPFKKSSADDMWRDLRELGAKGLSVLLFLSATLGLISVILSIMLLVHMSFYVHDPDDLLYFVLLHRDSLVDVSLILCLVTAGISIPLAVFVTLEEPVMSITFWPVALLLIAVLLFYLRSLFWLSRRDHAKAFIELVSAAYDQHQKEPKAEERSEEKPEEVKASKGDDDLHESTM